MENTSALSTNNTRLLSTPFEVGFLNYSSQLNETCSKLDNATTPENPLYVLIYVSIFYSVIFLCGVAGNGLVLFVLWRNKDMRNSTNLLLANLSIADLFVLLVCMPTAIAEFYCKEVWYLGEAMCKLIPFLETVVIHASMLSILVISVERYYAICKPLHADQRCTTRKTGKILVGIWICAISVTTPFFAIAKERDAWLGDTPVKVCSTSIDEYWKKIYIVTVNVVLYATPGLLLIIIYAMICRSLMADRKNVVVGTCRVGSERREKVIKQRQQVVYLLISVILLFFFCTLPFRVFSMWLIFSSLEEKESIPFEGMVNLVYCVRILFYLNSAGNPILYNLISTKFRNAFLRAISLRKSLRNDMLSRQNTFSTYEGSFKRRFKSMGEQDACNRLNSNVRNPFLAKSNSYEDKNRAVRVSCHTHLKEGAQHEAEYVLLHFVHVTGDSNVSPVNCSEDLAISLSRAKGQA